MGSLRGVLVFVDTLARVEDAAGFEALANVDDAVAAAAVLPFVCDFDSFR